MLVHSTPRRAAFRPLKLAAFFLAAFLLCHSSAFAQGPETIKGKVVDDSGHVVAGATVMVTRGPDRLTQQTATDSTGHYGTRFEQGTGDYLVYISAPGFTAARRRVQKQAAESELIADFTLARNVATLATVKVSAQKPVRATNNVNPTQLETGASEKWQDGVSGQIAPTVAGDLNAVAGTMSNVTMTPGGASILGSGSESSLNTLNGMGLSAGSIPRAARTETRVTGATFDPTRGGFAGANIDVRLGPGSRNYMRRSGFFTVDPRQLQFADPTTRSLGTAQAGYRASFGADGELIRKALTYNVSGDIAKNQSNPTTLISAEADALLLAGVSPDSVTRLIALAGPRGIGLSGNGVPGDQQHQAVTFLGRIDDTRDTMKTRALTSYLGYTRDGALGFSPLAAPSSAGQRRERTAGVQLTLGNYVGPGSRILNETHLAISGVHTNVSPYLDQPGATVLVRSAGTDAANDITSLTLGGGSFFSTNDSRWTAEAANETAWNAYGRRHRFKTLLWGRADGLQQQGVPNALGTFAFNSIDDFAAGRPASFTRTLTQPEKSGTVWNGAAAIAHNYFPTRFFNVLYGARLEADGFASSPARNSALEQALGVQTGVAPASLHISPRAGFSYTYNRSKDNGSGTNQTNVGRFYRTTVGVIRGGIGEFRDLLRPGLLADASASTGLAGATTTLSCVGSAVPAADWSLFASDPSSIPTQCLDGSGVLAERSPPVTLISPKYDVPHSWRGSLNWSTNVSNWLLNLSGLASYDLSQPGVVDANFSGVRRLSLANEANRPVFVSTASIDPGSGSVSSSESRRSTDFGSVSTRVSDLRGYGGQLNLGIAPDVFRFRGPYSFYTSLGYSLQWSRRQYRGFDGASFGDPRVKEWAPNSADARHVIVLTGGFSAPYVGTVTLFARAQSGLPFTPIVQGDVNGDGRGGDRAFIPDPATVADAALGNGLKSLLSTGSSSARSCILANLGVVAGRNGCRGPWTESLNIQWRPRTPRRWGGRVVPNVYLQNVLAGLDQAFHGTNGLRGWGSQIAPNPVLLIPRGFDAGSRSFKYDVNPRFADTRPGRSISFDPFRIVVDFSIDLSTNFPLQQLRRAIEPVKTPNGWEKRSADSLASFYLQNTSSIHKFLLEQTDSLFLNKTQVAGLRRADSVYSARVRAIYVPLGEFLAESGGVAGKAELDSAKATDRAYWKIFWEQPEIAGEFITPSQRELVPMFKSMISTPMKDREHSQWQFGYPVTFADKPKNP